MIRSQWSDSTAWLPPWPPPTLLLQLVSRGGGGGTPTPWTGDAAQHPIQVRAVQVRCHYYWSLEVTQIVLDL